MGEKVSSPKKGNYLTQKQRVWLGRYQQVVYRFVYLMELAQVITRYLGFGGNPFNRCPGRITKKKVTDAPKKKLLLLMLLLTIIFLLPPLSLLISLLLILLPLRLLNLLSFLLLTHPISYFPHSSTSVNTPAHASVIARASLLAAVPAPIAAHFSHPIPTPASTPAPVTFPSVTLLILVMLTFLLQLLLLLRILSLLQLYCSW